MTVKSFQTLAQLQKYLTTSGVLKANIVNIYFDSVSGQHVIVHG